MEKKYLSDLTQNNEITAHVKYAASSNETIVEIGVLNGHTTKFILENTKANVYGIDPIIPDSMDSALIGSEDKINELVTKFSNFTFIKDYSYNVVKNWDKKIDYIFIDGDHTYDAVKQDFEQWYPHVKVGGIISIHDSSANRGGPSFWPGPSKLADELISDVRVEYIETLTALTVFKKV
jgi:predicted O-methyltransferase YrrM